LGAPRASGFRVQAELRRNSGVVIRKTCVFNMDEDAQVTSASQACSKRPCQG